MNDCQCTKEKEIEEIHKEVSKLKQVVFEGNGGKPLNVAVEVLSTTVEDLKCIIVELKTGVNGLLKYQQTLEGEKKGRRNSRWAIGILATITATLLGLLIGVVTG